MNIRIWQWGGQSTQKMRMSEMGVREEMLFSFKGMIGRLNTILPRIHCQEFTTQTPNFKKKKKKKKGFPGGSVVKNPPANARDTGLIPDLGRSPAMEQQSLCPTTTETMLKNLGATTPEPLCPIQPVLHNKRSHHNEKPVYHS